MFLLIAIVLAVLTAWVWLPNLVDLMAIAAMLARRVAGDRSVVSSSATLPRLAFLVPAHNEELLISQCVRSLVMMEYPAHLRRIIVIADNSTDGTAQLAREAGAECMERLDPKRRGKPHALAWAIQQIRLAEVDACVIVDADTAVASGFANGLAALGPLEGIAAQAYIGTMNEWDNWLTRLAGVLARCRYEFSYVLRDKAGLNCPLTGNGMCIGRGLLEAHGWQALSLTENWELYARYTAEAIPIRFARNARLFTQQVRSMQQGQIQRSRWSAGRTWVLREWGMRILRGQRTSLLNKFATLAELAALTPVLHLTTVAAIVTLAILLQLPGHLWIAGFAAASLASHVIATAAVLVEHPEPGATLWAFARLPVYATWRLSVAAHTLLLPGSGEWRKTERNSPGTP
jgi:cellulose synthase/poly-beta-1,6-N-acetylglucosamine synthase-like glycosyltransferase